MNMVSVGDRRDARRQVEMFARFRHGLSTTTVVLKDLTPHGARVEGTGSRTRDEAVSLALPGMKPLLAFVAWANEHCAGLEFAEPLAQAGFDQLIESHGLNTGGMAIAV